MRHLLSLLLALGLALSFSLLTAVPALAFTEVWVDDVTDPLEDGSPAHPFDSIQEAIDYIAGIPDNGIVHVLDGSYYEDITLNNGVDVLGAGAAVTTIDGTGTSHVVSAGGSVGSGTVLDGFTITGGWANYGGGMHIDGSSLTVSNCIFTNNDTANQGGGMYIFNDCSPLVVNCVFQGNTSSDTGGAIGCRSGASPIIANCIIDGNTANNDGGGIFISSSSFPTIINNTIVNNDATTGGGIYADGLLPTITNNIIANNSATSGSGIYCSTPTLSINYNDVYNNTLFNCTSVNGLTTDPLFVGGGDYHLQGSSPCIDVGDNAAVATAGLTTDFEGEPRIFDGDDDGTDTVDMGADEYYVAPPPPPPSGTVGGTVFPIDKAALLLPWLGLGIALILAAGSLILIRRRAS